MLRRRRWASRSTRQGLGALGGNTVVAGHLREHARPQACRLLPAFSRRPAPQLSERCVAIQLPISAEHDSPASSTCCMCAYMDPSGGKEGGPQPIPIDGEQVRECRGELLDAVVEDERGLDGALPRGARLPAEDVAHALRTLSRATSCIPSAAACEQEPRHDRAARPARRRRAVAREEGHDDRVRRRESRPSSSSRRSPIRSRDTHQLLSRARRPDHRRHDARRPRHTRKAARSAIAAQREGQRACRPAVGPAISARWRS